MMTTEGDGNEDQWRNDDKVGGIDPTMDDEKQDGDSGSDGEGKENDTDKREKNKEDDEAR